MVTLGELIDHPDLGVLLATGPNDAMSRSIAGTYIVRNDQLHWPGPDWVMLIESDWSSNQESQRLIVHGAARENLCAVAMRDGMVHESAVTQAKSDDITLLTVRSDVPFRLIGYFVERRLLQEDSDLRANSQAAHWAMLDAVNVLSRLGKAGSGYRVGEQAGLADPAWADELSDAHWPIELSQPSAPIGEGMRIMAIAQLSGSVRGLLEKERDRIAEATILTMRRPAHDAVLIMLPAHLDPNSVISAIGCSVRAGLSERISFSTEIAKAERDAVAALRLAQWRGTPAGTIYLSEALTPVEWLIGSADLDELRRRVRQRFGRLRNLPELSASLKQWLVEDRNVGAAAAALHIHPNTLRYRLNRIEKLTACELSDVSGLAELYLSLLAFPGELGMTCGNGE